MYLAASLSLASIATALLFEAPRAVDVFKDMGTAIGTWSYQRQLADRDIERYLCSLKIRISNVLITQNNSFCYGI